MLHFGLTLVVFGLVPLVLKAGEASQVSDSAVVVEVLLALMVVVAEEILQVSGFAAVEELPLALMVAAAAAADEETHWEPGNAAVEKVLLVLTAVAVEDTPQVLRTAAVG